MASEMKVKDDLLYDVMKSCVNGTGEYNAREEHCSTSLT